MLDDVQSNHKVLQHSFQSNLARTPCGLYEALKKLLFFGQSWQFHLQTYLQWHLCKSFFKGISKLVKSLELKNCIAANRSMSWFVTSPKSQYVYSLLHSNQKKLHPRGAALILL